MLPIMANVAEQFPEYEFLVTGAPAIDEDFYPEFIENRPIRVISNITYEILSHSTAGLITSGTATLEAALFNVPQVVCYRAGNLSYFIAKQFVKLDYISLVNLILDREVVTELIQNDLNVERLGIEFDLILKGKSREKQLEAYQELNDLCGGVGASENTAKGMIAIANS